MVAPKSFLAEWHCKSSPSSGASPHLLSILLDQLPTHICIELRSIALVQRSNILISPHLLPPTQRLLAPIQLRLVGHEGCNPIHTLLGVCSMDYNGTDFLVDRHRIGLTVKRHKWWPWLHAPNDLHPGLDDEHHDVYGKSASTCTHAENGRGRVLMNVGRPCWVGNWT